MAIYVYSSFDRVEGLSWESFVRSNCSTIKLEKHEQAI
jgi:hypothetical protein